MEVTKKESIILPDSGNDIFGSKPPLDFDPFKFRLDLFEKFRSQWNEVANIKKVIDSLDVGSYQLTGNITDPVIISYTLSS